MKKGMIAILLSTVLISMQGCSNQNNNDIAESNNTSIEKIDSEEINERMYKVYEDNVKAIEEIYKKNNIEFKYSNTDKSGKYDNTKISFTNNEIDEDRAIKSTTFSIKFNSDNNISFVSVNAFMNIKSENIETNKFKFEDTMFYELSNQLINEEVNYSEVNNQINECVKNDEDKVIINTYGNIEETIDLEGSLLVYTIVIRP